MEIKISDVIKEKRRQIGVSQEVFAEAFGVTVQAVSKWETQASMPDITLLPKIAEYLHISMDELFFGDALAAVSVWDNIPDDGKLRVAQFKGNKMLKEEDYDPNVRIMLEIPENCETEFSVEIWGSADIDGDINGNVTAGGIVNCGNVGQCVTADGGINCGSIGQCATADGGINCGNIGQSATADGGINCGNIGQSANAGGGINCVTIARDAKAGGDISCQRIEGDAEAGRNIRCETIKGAASCKGDIIYEDKNGNRRNELNDEISRPICTDGNIPDDGRIRIVQYEGSNMLTKDELDPRLVITLAIPENFGEGFGVEVWGNAKIEGNIGGNLTAGGNAECLSVAGDVSANGNVRCETVACDVSAGRDIVHCGTVGCDATAGRDLTCGDIGCDATAQSGNIHCNGTIKGDAQCGGNIIYKK